MIKKTDPLCNCLRPLLDKTLENALAYRIKKEFPRIGGPRIRKLCAEMVLEVVHRHIRAKDYSNMVKSFGPRSVEIIRRLGGRR